MIKSKLFQNIISLSSAELLSKIMMFFYMSYLAHKIGTDGIGSIGLGQSIANFSFMALQIGFDNVSTREVARNKEILESFVNSVLAIRLIIAALLYSIIMVYILNSDKSFDIKLVVLIISINIFSFAILLNWVFIALEDMKIVAIRLIITSLLTLLGIIFIVKSKNDIILAAIIMTLAILINSIWLLIYYQNKYYKIKLNFNYKFAIDFLKNSSPITLTFLFVSINQNIGMLFIEKLRGTTYLYDIAIFQAAYKFMTLALVPSYIFQQSFYSKFSRSIDLISKNEILKKYATVTFVFGVFVSLATYFYSDKLILILWGSQFIESIQILKILSFTLILIYINVTYSTPLIAWNKEKETLKAIGIGSIFNVLVAALFISKYGAYGVAYSFFASEFVSACLQVYFMYRSKVNSYLFLFLKILVLGLISFSVIFIRFYINFKFDYLILVPITLFLYFALLHYSKLLKLNELFNITKT